MGPWVEQEHNLSTRPRLLTNKHIHFTLSPNSAKPEMSQQDRQLREKAPSAASDPKQRHWSHRA